MTQHQLKSNLIDNILNHVVNYMKIEEHLDTIEAMKKVYKSPVIDWLQDPLQDLCSKSPAYIYELIKRYPG